MNKTIPDSLKVYKHGQFHQYTSPTTGHEFAIAERDYINQIPMPDYIAYHHHDGQFLVLKQLGITNAYSFDIAYQNSITVEMKPRYHVNNTAIEKLGGSTRLCWMRDQGRMDTLAIRNHHGEITWQHDDISTEYAKALLAHHDVGGPRHDYPHLIQNTIPFYGDQMNN